MLLPIDNDSPSFPGWHIVSAYERGDVKDAFGRPVHSFVLGNLDKRMMELGDSISLPKHEDGRDIKPVSLCKWGLHSGANAKSAIYYMALKECLGDELALTRTVSTGRGEMIFFEDWDGATIEKIEKAAHETRTVVGYLTYEKMEEVVSVVAKRTLKEMLKRLGDSWGVKYRPRDAASWYEAIYKILFSNHSRLLSFLDRKETWKSKGKPTTFASPFRPGDAIRALQPIYDNVALLAAFAPLMGDTEGKIYYTALRLFGYFLDVERTGCLRALDLLYRSIPQSTPFNREFEIELQASFNYAMTWAEGWDLMRLANVEVDFSEWLRKRVPSLQEQEEV